MAGTRQPTALVEAKGKKHLTKAETAQRKAREPVLSASSEGEGSKIRAPSWLPKWLAEDFNDLRAQLVTAGIFAKMDRDTLGRYLVAQHQFVAAMKRLNDALDSGDEEGCATWGREQERAFKQARACANDLGLTVTSRCKLVLPEGAKDKSPPNPVLELLKRKEERAANG